MTALSEEHKRALASRLQRIDNLVQELACRMNPTGSESLFEEIDAFHMDRIRERRRTYPL